MDTTQTELLRCKGREFSTGELSLIKEIVGDFPGLARTELANTVCELLNWKSPGNKLKTVECRTFLELLDTRGVLKLPEKRNTFKKKSVAVAVPIPPIRKTEPLAEVTGSVEDFTPLDVELVETKEQRHLFRDLVKDYHYLGYATPYGARLQYLAYVSKPVRRIAGCIQFTSPAWRMRARDEWIGWDDAVRGQRLQHIVNNSRFLVLVRVRNLPSMLLSMVLKRLREDWHAHYGLEPWLAETLVDQELYHGGCYLAANWQVLGQTSGRGRMDREHERHGARVKTVMVYPLVRNALHLLRNGGGHQ
jgi:hypothetical protein